MPEKKEPLSFKRTLQLPGRISPAEMALIDKLCDKRKALNLNRTSRIDVIMLAVRFASGENFSMDEYL